MLDLSHRTIRVAVAPRCNMRCVYCDAHSERTKRKPGAMEDFRRKPLEEGCIDTKTYLEIIRILHDVGFGGITLTGGEPTLNPDWPVFIEEAKKMGFARVGLTTNGMLLNTYLKKHQKVPDGLTLLTLSLDSIDPTEFRAITKTGNLDEILLGLKGVRALRPDLTIRVNRVLMRSQMPFLVNFIRYCENTGFISEINLLNLILKWNESKDFFFKEFISAKEVIETLHEQLQIVFERDVKDEFRVTLPSGLKVILKDTNLTMRNQNCETCPVYCQEGYFTTRVATDGTIVNCPDYGARLPYVDGARELKAGMLDTRIRELVKVFETAELRNTLSDFLSRNQLVTNIRSNGAAYSRKPH